MQSVLAQHLQDIHATAWQVADYGRASQNGDVFAIAGVTVLGFWVVAAIWVVARARERRRRLDLIEQALRNPGLSPQTQTELVKALQPAQPRRWMFSLGWLGLFAGIAWLCTDPRRDEFTAAIVVTVASFAFVTLPVALKELEARRA